MSLFTKIFGTKNDKDISRLSPVVDKVNSYSSWAEGIKSEDFPKETEKLKKRLSEGESLDSLLPEAFALAREASYRVLGERHYDVQIMGASVLHQGKILEMKTGEGKTLTCVPAAYLNALEGKGVHVVTVNDYLAQRDAAWMGPVYNFLGLSVGVIISNMDNERRREAYACDITYGTNNEFGFDYLRDNMKYRYEDKIQPKHHYCIVDEIDSILIDEARTPLIISGPADDDTEFARNAEKITSYFKECEKDPETGEYPEASAFARFDEKSKLEPDGDYKIDEKRKQVTFTKEGMLHMEEFLKRTGAISGSLYDDENFEYIHYVTQAMNARHLYKKDVDYVVQEGQIQIVDEFTGRILYGRRYSDGLHQAIEAKEHIKVLGKNKTLATITFQNFFRMYDKLSGMTGTADTEAPEFNSIYNLDVVVIPTHLPVQRKDLDDYVFLNDQFKYKAICEEISRVHATGQPILVGTVSIEKSEFLSSLLRKIGIPHEVLNAKNHAREAVIIENAGAAGSVTIATNMAGRGTDIKLGGSIDYMARKICGSDASEEELKTARKRVYPQWRAEYEKVKALGGLYILGTERHESRRIDNQLRGRSGRQGDPGTSRFFVSFDDTLLRLFAKDNIKATVARLGMNNGEPLEHSMVSKIIETAQKRVEERNFEIRKHLLEYDNVLNEQRNFIYSQRDDILRDENIIGRVINAAGDYIDEICEEPFSSVHDLLLDRIGFDWTPEEGNEKLSKTDLASSIKALVSSQIDEKVKLTGPEIFSMFTRQTYLRHIDVRWQNHLEELEDLRDSVALRSYAQKNPLLEYKLEGFDIFDEMLDKIRTAVVKTVVSVKIRTNPADPRRHAARRVQESHSSVEQFNDRARAQMQKAREAKENGNTSPVQVIRNAPKVGRNDPCPCGSGKKYKNCCGRNQSFNS
ncbi:MAG: preprotein translocase subunit SecA [Sphaerochaetaceae bacterium]|nr:preprotein translocase subunit SecA [Sphaerochaetaceae bacterium]